MVDLTKYLLLFWFSLLVWLAFLGANTVAKGHMVWVTATTDVLPVKQEQADAPKIKAKVVSPVPVTAEVSPKELVGMPKFKGWVMPPMPEPILWFGVMETEDRLGLLGSDS